MHARVALLSLALTLPSLTAHAQESVAGSGMGQGEAAITARSDVRLSMESVPGTSGARLAAIGRAVGARMAQLRQCYHEAVAARPTVQGTLRMRITLAEGARTPAIEVAEDGVHDAGTVDCVRAQLGQIAIADIERPASALVVLVLANSAAAGTAQAAERAAEEGVVTVTRTSGRPEASGEAPGVRFVVRGEASASDELVAEAQRVMRASVAGMMDCRRRASRRHSPEGRIDISFDMRPGQPLVVRVVRTTVHDERSSACLVTALQREHRLPAQGPATLEAEIHFEP